MVVVDVGVGGRVNEVDKATIGEEIASAVRSIDVSVSGEEFGLGFEFESDEFVAEARIGLGHVPVRGLSTMFLVFDGIHQDNARLFLHMNEAAS